MDPGHTDAGSSLTLSVLLSDPAEVSGGTFITWRRRFRREKPTPTAHATLGRGDGILFYSEDMHNVTPVESGQRHAFVIELWVAPAAPA